MNNMKRVEKHSIKRENSKDELFKYIDNIGWQSKNLYNLGNYMIRQEYFKTKKEKENGLIEYYKIMNYNELYPIIKDTDTYKEINSVIGQQVLRRLASDWSGFKKGIEEYFKNPSAYTGIPKIPKYLPKEDGRRCFSTTNQRYKIKDGYIYFTMEILKCLNNRFKTNIPEDSKLGELRFIPKSKDEYVVEVVYSVNVPEQIENSNRVVAIDIGVDRLMTLVTNCKVEPIAINGRPLKSINQYYNKKLAEMKSKLKIRNDKNWSRELGRFTDKRNKKVEDYIHKSTRIIVDYCKDNNIDTLICGHNKGWKQESKMSKTQNQNFIGIPHTIMINQLKYKCENYGIKFIETEESYTSGTSFLDKESPTEDFYNKSRRKHRGLFVSDNGEEINADVNGAYQIMKKVFPDMFIEGVEDEWKHPKIINIL